MLRLIFLMILFALISTGSLNLYAQDTAAPVLSVTDRLEKLRAQLREVKAKEADLQERVRKLDVELQPDNLERAVSHIPSFKPDELCEERRRQLESEKTKAQEQLNSLVESRLDLEKTITQTEIEIHRLKGQSLDAAAASAAKTTPPKTAEPAPPANEASEKTPQATRKAKPNRPSSRRARGSKPTRSSQ